ncbi:hypothetical protein FRB99_002298 [Tulasnella sp. 403]|nr:hypothetical protein FRB99_002298 [Tulasnella sp. 403]
MLMRHWGCVTSTQKTNLSKRLKSGQSQLNGYDDLNEQDSLVVRDFFDWDGGQSGNGKAEDSSAEKMPFSGIDRDDQPRIKNTENTSVLGIPVVDDYDGVGLIDQFIPPSIGHRARATQPDFDSLITFGSPFSNTQLQGTGQSAIQSPAPAPVVRPLPPLATTRAILTPSIASQANISSRYAGGHMGSTPTGAEQLVLEIAEADVQISEAQIKLSEKTIELEKAKKAVLECKLMMARRLAGAAASRDTC